MAEFDRLKCARSKEQFLRALLLRLHPEKNGMVSLEEEWKQKHMWAIGLWRDLKCGIVPAL